MLVSCITDFERRNATQGEEVDIAGRGGFIRVVFSRPSEQVSAGMNRIAVSLGRLKS